MNRYIEVRKINQFSCSVCSIHHSELPIDSLVNVGFVASGTGSMTIHSFRLCPNCKRELIDKLTNQLKEKENK